MWSVFFWWKEYPHKNHVRHVLESKCRDVKGFNNGTYLDVARAWGLDSSLSEISDLAMFFTMSRTRAKELLKKFIRSHG